MKALGIVAAYLLVTAYVQFMIGWGLSIIWEWLVVPTFGMQSLSIASSISLLLVAGYIFDKWQKPKSDVDHIEVLSWSIAHGTLKPLFAIMFAYVVSMCL